MPKRRQRPTGLGQFPKRDERAVDRRVNLSGGPLITWDGTGTDHLEAEHQGDDRGEGEDQYPRSAADSERWSVAHVPIS